MVTPSVKRRPLRSLSTISLQSRNSPINCPIFVAPMSWLLLANTHPSNAVQMAISTKVSKWTATNPVFLKEKASPWMKRKKRSKTLGKRWPKPLVVKSRVLEVVMNVSCPLRKSALTFVFFLARSPKFVA